MDQDPTATAGATGSAWLQYLQSIHDLQQQSIQKQQQLWKDYVQSLQSSHHEARGDAADAYRTYVQDMQSALSHDAQGEAVSAYQKYADALQELQAACEKEAIHASSDPQRAAESIRSLYFDPDRTRKITDAYNGYTDAVKKWLSSVQDRLTEAHQKYAQAVSGTLQQDDAASAAKAAYERYVKGVYGTYRSAAESAQESADDAVDKATKKRK